MKDSEMTILIAVAVVVAVGLFAGIGFGVHALIDNHDVKEDVSLSNAIEQANRTKGKILYDSGPYYGLTLDTWNNSSSDFYSSGSGWNRYVVHLNNDTLVVERYHSDSTTKPTADTKGDLEGVYYYSVLSVNRVTFTEDGITKIWYGGMI